VLHSRNKERSVGIGKKNQKEVPPTPYSLVPAFMRLIQRERISRFLFRLSRYAYCSAFSTLGRAALMQFLLRPLNPLARRKILSLFMLHS
jgi:hypothetical protein